MDKKLIIKAIKHGMSLTEIAKPLGIAKTTCWMLLQKDEDYKKAITEWKISKENIARDILEMSKR